MFPIFKMGLELSQSTDCFLNAEKWLKSTACESLPQLSLKSAGAVSFTAGEAELELKIRMTFIPGFIPESENLI